MPPRPFKPCLKCKNLHRNPNGYCDDHQPEDKEYDNRRGSASSRGYDSRWKKVRDRKIQHDPLCECHRCKEMDRHRMAEVVHHVKPIKTHPELRLVWSNLMSMCFDCHEVSEGRGFDEEYNKWKRNKTEGWINGA